MFSLQEIFSSMSVVKLQHFIFMIWSREISKIMYQADAVLQRILVRNLNEAKVYWSKVQGVLLRFKKMKEMIL